MESEGTGREWKIIRCEEDPDNEHYFGAGRPCEICHNCWTVCKSDYDAHLRVCRERQREKLGWKKSDYGDGEYCPVSKDPALASAIRKQGNLHLGGLVYSLSQNEKWLRRWRDSNI